MDPLCRQIPLAFTKKNQHGAASKTFRLKSHTTRSTLLVKIDMALQDAAWIPSTKNRRLPGNQLGRLSELMA